MKNWEEVGTLLEENSIELLEVVEDYGGRAMFGDTTTGFKLDIDNFKKACVLLDYLELSYSTDSMGMNFIIY